MVMKSSFVLFLLTFLIAACAFERSSGMQETENEPVSWVAEENFRDFPEYLEISVLHELPPAARCQNPSCNRVAIDRNKYLKAILITEENYESIIIGTWTGGDCAVDFWHMSASGDFSSQYPQNNEIYAWAGQYSFINDVYREIGKNNSNKAEHNEANLYYVPHRDQIIFRGTRSLTGEDNNGKPVFTYYEEPVYFYFKRCSIVNNAAM